jgi:hypothetical protein
MAPTRIQLEVFAVALILSACAGVFLARALIVADRSKQQALDSAASAFVAGIQMLQAEARLAERRKLNSLGYPTGRSGALRDDADCVLIWHEVTQHDAPLDARFVADSTIGDRCEYRLSGTAESSASIRYWPLGADGSGGDSLRGGARVTRGMHVQVTLDDRSTS